MYVVVFQLPTTRLVEARKLAPSEKLNAAKFARAGASFLDREIDWTRTSFDGRGDIRVEFRQRKLGGCLPQSQSYYFVHK